MRMGFSDRNEAGRQLARLLARMAEDKPVVLAIARGGVPVAYEVAHALHAPLDVVVVRRLAWPGAAGRTLVAALAEGGVVVPDRVHGQNPEGATAEAPAEEATPASPASIDAEALAAALAVEEPEMARRGALYRRGAQPLPLGGRTAILVDDGLGSGITQRAAIEAVRRRGPARLVLAVPVGSLDVVTELRGMVDELVCVEARLARWATGLSYSVFPSLDDGEVCRLLELAAVERAADPADATGAGPRPAVPAAD